MKFSILSFSLFFSLCLTPAFSFGSEETERFRQAAELYEAHLDPQTDADMAQLMWKLAKQHPELKTQYAQIIKKRASQASQTASLADPQ